LLEPSYAVQFIDERDQIVNVETRCLLIAPFGPEFRPVFEVTRQVLEENGITVVSIDKFLAGASLANQVTDAIRACDFVVADVSHQNPNVFYELGFAHALRKHTIILMNAKSAQRIPSDLAGFLYLVYDEDNFKELSWNLRRAVQHYISSRKGEV
jgi:predicted nucleotide-binding protein